MLFGSGCCPQVAAGLVNGVLTRGKPFRILLVVGARTGLIVGGVVDTRLEICSETIASSVA